jgi:hypothetical protein
VMQYFESIFNKTIHYSKVKRKWRSAAPERNPSTPQNIR